mmetsp:Transcript_9243/g.30859  ORF Transcript_9243/g.30859 Transcript_9243/m.30859 type:complete len:244 (-) Transcript_9243:638-1369(-)
MQVTLPIALQSFDNAKRVQFRTSVAATAAVDPSTVIINKVQAARRSSSNVQVGFSIVTATQTDARAVAGNLNLKNLNEQFRRHGLPEASATTNPQITSFSASTSSGVPLSYTAMIAACALGGVLLAVIVFYCLSYSGVRRRREKVAPRLSVVQYFNSDVSRQRRNSINERDFALAFSLARRDRSRSGVGEVQPNIARKRSGSATAIEIGNDFVRVWNPEHPRRNSASTAQHPNAANITVEDLE